MDLNAAESSSGGLFTDYVTNIYIYVMLIFFPIFTGFRGYADITRSKYLFFLVATLLWLALLLIGGVRSLLKNGCRKKKHLFLSAAPVRAAVVLFLLFCCASAFLSPYRGASLSGSGRYEGLFTTLLYGAVMLCISAFGKVRRGYVIAFAVSVSICCITACLQLLGFNIFSLFPNQYSYYDAHIQYSSEFLGTIGNTNLLSGLLCLAIPLFLTGFITEGRPSVFLLLPAFLASFVLFASRVSGGAVALAVYLAVCAPFLITTRSRLIRWLFSMSVVSSAIALSLSYAVEYDGQAVRFSLAGGTAFTAFAAGTLLLILLATFVLFFTKDSVFPNPRRLGGTVAAVIVLLAASCAAAIYFYHGSSGTVYELSRVLHGDIRDEFGSSRIRIWREVLALVPERPLLGGGPGTLGSRLDIRFSRYVPETGRTLASFVDNAHNEYLGYLADIGIPGLLSYLAAIILTVRRWLRSPKAETLPPAFACSLVCYWVEGFFGLGLCIVAPVFWIFWGLALNNMYVDKSATERNVISEP